jgi:hypothetical protein
MRTVRRLYFYAVSLVSLEIVLWGLIRLARSIFCPANTVCGAGSMLAEGLALILVGVPVFLFHWLMSQRFARSDPEERAAGLRAAFLYGVLLGTFIPIVQNLLSLLDRLALSVVGLSSTRAFIGPSQTWSDNLIAMLMNALVAVYFIYILRGDWRSISPRDSFTGLRRIYRFAWLVYGLAMVIASLQQLLRFVLNVSPDTFGFLYRASGAHGVVLALVGVPVWAVTWKTLQDSLAEPAERESLLRLGMLYLLSLAGVVTVLATGGTILDMLLRLLLGERTAFLNFVQKISGPLSVGIPFAGLWAYYGHWLGRAMAADPDAPRRAGLRRLYSYVLAAIGLGAAFTGLALLLAFVVDAALGRVGWGSALRSQLAAALATLAVGLPLWLVTWRPMQAEALTQGDTGDHARRSVVRKVYLYLVMFASVVGGMITAVGLLTILLRAVFDQPQSDLARSALNMMATLFLFAGMGIYHGLTLGRDGRSASAALAAQHAAFSVLIFDPGEGFGEELLAAILKATPTLPVTLQPAGKPVPRGAAPKVVVLPSNLAFDPTEGLRKWLEKYAGPRIVVPQVTGRWIVAGMIRTPASAVAQAIRQLAEGGQVSQKAASPGWMVAVYIAAALFGVELLFLLTGLVVSLLGG